MYILQQLAPLPHQVQEQINAKLWLQGPQDLVQTHENRIRELKEKQSQCLNFNVIGDRKRRNV